MQNVIKIQAQCFKPTGEGTFPDSCSLDQTIGELKFILNRNTSNPTITLNIDDKIAYVIDAEIAGKVMELIAKRTIVDCGKPR